jgi:AmmeMemoRadiSam system protein B
MSAGSIAVRPPAVAGMFYPARAEAVRSLLRQCFAGSVAPDPDAAVPVAIVVPHAGHIYSGPIAASAYRRVEQAHDVIHRVLLLGPSHFVPFRGLALTSADRWETPIGLVPIDIDAVERLQRLPSVRVDDAPHAREHSLEVQLPFLQTVLDDFTLVPVAVGDATPEEVAPVIEAMWTDPHTLVVVSTDLSHYHRYETAIRQDAATAAAIVDLRYADIGDHDACGARPLRGLLRAVEARRLRVEQIDLRNSGDTAGDRSRVVGYGAFAIV